jgi:hypothetical protein
MEEEFPWRYGPCFILRSPFSHLAVALGRWTEQQPHEVTEDGPVLLFREIDWEEAVSVREED